MAHSNYENSLFRELENLNKKFDKLLKTNNEQSLTIYSLNLEVKKLNKTLEEKNKLIKKQEEIIDKLKNQNNKNSSNSSKPSSTNFSNKKTGANLYNSRTKSNKSKGAQIGHKGSNLSKEKVEKLIEEKKVKVVNIKHIINGKENEKDTIKYKIGLEIVPVVYRHIFKHSPNSNSKLPKEFQTDATYDNSIKALCIELMTYDVVSLDRTTDFFNIISNNVINLSKGTLINFLKDFSNKSYKTLDNITEKLLYEKVMHTDETSTKFNGKNMSVRCYSNKQNVIYKSHKNKGHKPILEDGILTNYTGNIMGDHDTTLYKYGNNNYECNVHLSRYLEELIQNVNVSWPSDMKKLFNMMLNTRKIAMAYGLSKFDDDKITEYNLMFDKILDEASIQNKEIKSSFYREKANKLLNRLKKYKKNHLYFIESFDIPYDNNMSEQDLRVFKIKTKISGGFRSMDGASNYTDALSIIKTSIKRNINPFDSIKNILDGKVLFAN